MYILRKSSRWSENTKFGYSGPSCNHAGIEKGKIYFSYEEAFEDKQKLDRVNPVGFDVINCETNEIANLAKRPK